MPKFLTLAAAAIAISAAAATAPALAPQSAAQAQQTQGGESAEVSAGKVDAFAAAIVRIQEISDEWQQRLATAESAEQQQAMRKEANSEMLSAVEGEGISVEEYSRIANLASSDPALQQRINNAVQELREEG
ncbi:DUF4168 domain-containing protein [Minwuia thermotolerans]|nr:DUF4168 domain-containing protein [Minwuia thermotolerans]